jgi:RimJ/RimL family protein N-acetyltransferase
MTLRIATNRLLIRPFVPDDWRTVHAYMSDGEVTAHLPEGVLDEDGAREFVAKAADRVYALELSSSRELIGHMHFHPWFGPLTHEIGWVVAPPHQRRGYATEAAGALLDHAFTTLGLHRVIATCLTENTASAGVMEKLGMRREARFRQCHRRDDGTWSDEYFYAVLADEWPLAEGYSG